MGNPLYCNVIGTTNGIVQENHLLIGNETSNPTIGVAAEEKAVEVFKSLCDVYQKGSGDLDQDTLYDMLQEGCLESEDEKVRVFINWPNVIK